MDRDPDFTTQTAGEFAQLIGDLETLGSHIDVVYSEISESLPDLHRQLQEGRHESESLIARSDGGRAGGRRDIISATIDEVDELAASYSRIHHDNASHLQSIVEGLAATTRSGWS